MACRVEETAEEIQAGQRKYWESELLHNSDLAELLCKTIKEIERSNSVSGGINRVVLHPSVAKWWTDHQIRDGKIQQEKLEKLIREKTSALSKLTPYERKILGLPDA